MVKAFRADHKLASERAEEVEEEEQPTKSKASATLTYTVCIVFSCTNPIIFTTNFSLDSIMHITCSSTIPIIFTAMQLLDTITFPTSITADITNSFFYTLIA